jgi:GNAT superfamily N-acetyltransferase
VYFYNYSTWLGRNGIWLEDVYVTPAYRGRGAGKALLKHYAARPAPGANRSCRQSTIRIPSSSMRRASSSTAIK